MRRILRFVILGGALLLFLTCGGGKDATGPAGLPASQEDPAKHFQLTHEAVVIRDGAKAVKQISPDHSTFTLDGSAHGVEGLSAGQVLIIPGVDAGKVTSVGKSGNDVTVELGPARIAEVIQDGVLEWAPQKVDLDHGVWIVQPQQARVTRLWEGRPVTPDAIQLGNFFASTAYADNPQKVELSVDDYKVAIQYSHDTWTLIAKKNLKGVTVSISVKVKFETIETKGRIEIGYGTVTGYNLSTPVKGYIELEVTCTSTDARFFPPQAVIELPFEYVTPLVIYGIPCYVGLNLNFLIQPSLSTQNSGITMRLRSDFDGNPCVNYTNGTMEPCTNIQWEKPPDPLSGVTAVPSPGHTAMVFAVQCPKISFGVGTQSIVRGGVYVDMVTAVGATLFGATSLLPCRQLTLSRTLGAGLEFELGPKLFEKLLENLSKKLKLKVEKKIELAREDLHWHFPNVKGCE